MKLQRIWFFVAVAAICAGSMHVHAAQEESSQDSSLQKWIDSLVSLVNPQGFVVSDYQVKHILSAKI